MLYLKNRAGTIFEAHELDPDGERRLQSGTWDRKGVVQLGARRIIFRIVGLPSRRYVRTKLPAPSARLYRHLPKDRCRATYRSPCGSRILGPPVYAARPPPAVKQASTTIKRQYDLSHWTWTSTALRRSGAPLRCASFARSKNDKDHDVRRVERRTADATKRVLRRQRRKMDKIEVLVQNLEIDWRLRQASDAVCASSDCEQDKSEVRDEFLEAFGPLEPVPTLPFLKDLTKETC